MSPVSAVAAANMSFPGRAATTHARVGGTGSMLPAASIPRTQNSCVPAARPEYVAGEAHASHAPASSRHSKPTASGDEENVNVAEGDDVVGDGPLVIVVDGAAVSDGLVADTRSHAWPVAPFLPSTAIRYVCPATVLNVTLLAPTVEPSSSFDATRVSAETLPPV